MVTNAQNGNGYFNVRFGSEKELRDATFMNVNLGLQLGTFITDNLAVELDCITSVKRKNVYSHAYGGNIIYQFDTYDPTITPYVKLGCSYKTYEYELAGCSHGVNLKYGAGLNVLMSKWVTLNFGLNLQHFFNKDEGGWENLIPTNSCETEIGVCFAF